jgi:beta-phosphoglucomutase family hydrolase
MGPGLPAEVRACLFDMDGVLLASATVHAAAWKEAFDGFLGARARAAGTPFVPFDRVADYERYVDGRSRLDGTRTFLAARGIHLPEGTPADPDDAETVHGLSRRKDEVFTRLLHEHPVSAFEGSTRYVRAVRGLGLRTAVVSSSKHCRALLESAHIAGFFDAVVDGNLIARRSLAGKPAPDAYLEAAQMLSSPSRECAVFEDAISGVEAGRAGSFGYVVGVDRLGQAAELRRHGATVVVKDLAELLEAK